MLMIIEGISGHLAEKGSLSGRRSGGRVLADKPGLRDCKGSMSMPGHSMAVD